MLYGAVIGTILGFFAGITPGIHSNTFSALIVSASAFLFLQFSPADVSAMIVTSAVAYTVANIIPATFLGLPDEDTAISILPTHRMVLEGRGFEAVSISCFSSLIAIFVSLPLFFTALFVGTNYDLFKKATPFVLLLTALVLIISERGEEFEGSLSVWRKRFYATLVFLCSGFLGFVALNSEFPRVNPAGSVLLPLLTGLFGAPVLLISVFSKSSNIPRQERRVAFPSVFSALKGSIAGFFVSIFPGISSGVATVVSSIGERSEKGYIVAMSSANTANAILCFFMLIAAGRTRSGASDALKSLNLVPSFQEIAVLSIFSGVVALLLTLFFGLVIAEKIERMDGRKLSLSVLVFLTAIVLLLTGLQGLAILLSAIPIGLSTHFLGVRRINCMGCLMVPVMIWYTG